MKVAIVHYWFTSWRGGERVVEQFLKLYPDADVYTHVADPALMQRRLPGVRVFETLIARLPFGRRMFRMYLPLMPMALEELDLQEYDLIISSESGPAKGIIKRPDAIHLCYCHSPMRYIWDMAKSYHASVGGLKALVLRLMSTRLRIWDVTSAVRVDQFIANSTFVAQRIDAYYGKQSLVVHPPVAMPEALPAKPACDTAGPYYVVAGELVGYKRVDLAIQAANALKRRLVIVGAGEQLANLKAIAGPTIEFVGRVSDEEFSRWLVGARALLFPGIEDFGMVPIEAMASGTPIIALARGGALDYLVAGVNGVALRDQTAEALADAMREFESCEHRFERERIRKTVLGFSEFRFRRQITDIVNALRERHRMKQPQEIIFSESGVPSLSEVRSRRFAVA